MFLFKFLEAHLHHLHLVQLFIYPVHSARWASDRRQMGIRRILFDLVHRRSDISLQRVELLRGGGGAAAVDPLANLWGTMLLNME